MFQVEGKLLTITKSAWREMDRFGLSIQKLITMIEEGERQLESRKARKWLVQARRADRFILIRYVELPDKLVVVNIGQTTRKVV